MEDSVKQEYEMVHREIVEVRTCITEYMKMFFALGIGVIGVFAFFAGKAFFVAESGPSPVNDHGAISLTPEQWGYVPLALAEIILFFASLLFHKFNTHNRGCGYMRALELERHWPVSSTETERQSPAGSADKEIRLWQSTLAVPFQQSPDFRWGRIVSESHFKTLREYCTDAESECAHPFAYRKLGTTLKKSGRGLSMVFRATIYRHQIRSWTFPFQVAFGPFIMTAFLLLTWTSIAYYTHLTANMILQVLLVAHLFVSWLGLGYRMFRLCGDVGDRTIELWCWRIMVQRHDALWSNGIKVAYVGWFPKKASDEIKMPDQEDFQR